MPAYFENGVFGGGVPAWHGLGTTVEADVLTADQVVEIVPELGYEVEMLPLRILWHDDQVLTSDRFATVRADGRVLGAGMTGRYQVIQNRDAFAFMDELVGSGEAKYHTAGTLRDGADAWMLARFSKDLLIGGIESERIQQFLLVTNNFNRQSSLIAKLVRTRVVCANTLDVALGETGREIRIRHVSGENGQALDGKIAEARRVLEIAFASSIEFEETAEALLSAPMSSREFGRFLKDLIPLPKDANPDKDRAARNKMEARDTIRAIFNQADNLANVRGTRWAAYNAVAEYFDHHSQLRSSAKNEAGAEDSRMENRLVRITSDYKLKDQALDLLRV